MIDLKELEKLRYQIPIKKELNEIDKNFNIVHYINRVPYNVNFYKTIANTYIGDDKLIKKRNQVIKINYITDLSWHELQLLQTGPDKFTSMVNLYNEYALKKDLHQIVDLKILKEEYDYYNKYDQNIEINNTLIKKLRSQIKFYCNNEKVKNLRI